MNIDRISVFNELKTKLHLIDKSIDLEWGVDLITLKKIALNHFQNNDYIYLDFGDCKIFSDFEIKLSLSKLVSEGLRFTKIGGALNNNDEAKELCSKFEKVLGTPDSCSETYGELRASWEDDDSKIVIYPRHSMGGEWFEYSIQTKRKY